MYRSSCFTACPRESPKVLIMFMKFCNSADRIAVGSKLRPLVHTIMKERKIAKNRKKAEGQREDSLQEWRKRQVERYGKEQTRKMISQLEVKESIRRYNRLDRLMPGAVFYYQGVRYVMRGQHSNGQYLQAVGMGDKDFPAKKCKIVVHNQGLVFVS